MVKEIFDLLENQYEKSKKLNDELYEGEKDLRAKFKGETLLNALTSLREETYTKLTQLEESTRTSALGIVESTRDTFRKIVTAAPGGDFTSDITALQAIGVADLTEEDKNAYMLKYAKSYSATKALEKLFYGKQPTASPLLLLDSVIEPIKGFTRDCKDPNNNFQCAVFLDAKSSAVYNTLVELDNIMNQYNWI